MSKNSQYVCNSCGAITMKWSGRCDSCGEWNTIEEQSGVASPYANKARLKDAKGNKLEFVSLGSAITESKRIMTDISELDRVLGGGLVEDSAVLIGGDPGIGKSTILLQMVCNLARKGVAAAYISAEESVSQVKSRAQRLGLADAPVMLAAANQVSEIISAINSPSRPQVIIVDSIQTIYHSGVESAPGTVSQVRASAHDLIQAAKRAGVSIIFVGHVTKDGQIAGPRVLEHMVDSVLYFEGERSHQFRILRSVKNRFGGTDEIGVFEMASTGLREITNPSALFIGEHDSGISGSSIFAGMEGSRPILVEIQALVSASFMATPRRAVIGWDTNRLAMLLAVLDARAGYSLTGDEVYLNIAGGMRISEPAADMAVVASILSAASNEPLPGHSVYFGEVGLSGEIRSVPRMETRLKEAEKLGFKTAFVPASAKSIETSMRLVAIKHVGEIASGFKKRKKRRAESEMVAD